MKKNIVALVLSIPQIIFFSIFFFKYDSRGITTMLLIVPILIIAIILKKKNNKATTTGFLFLLSGIVIFGVIWLFAYVNNHSFPENLGYGIVSWVVCQLCAFISYVKGLSKNDDTVAV